MNPPEDPWLATRTTLLEKMRDLDNGEVWEDFFEKYGRLIFNFTLRAGLRPEDARDIVQETVTAVARHIEGFRYDRSKGSFKSWLLTITRSKIVNRWRKLSREPSASPQPNVDEESATALIDRLPHPDSLNVDEIWEREWQDALLGAALARVRKEVEARHFQVFDCFVNKGWPAAEVAERLQVKPEQVYVIKHRIAERLRQEVERLKKEWGAQDE